MRIQQSAIVVALLVCAAIPLHAEIPVSEGTLLPDILYTQDEDDYITHAKPLTIGFRQSGIPIVSKDKNGKLDGIAPQCIALLEWKSGLFCHFILMDNDDNVPDALASGRYDGIVTFTDAGGTFGSSVNVTPPFLSAAMVLVINDDIQYSSASNLRFVLKNGFETGAAFIRKTNHDSTIYYLRTNDIEDCLDAIATGRADATYMNTYTASYLLQKPQFKHLRVIPQLFFNQYLCLAVRSDSDPRLISILTKAAGAFTSTETQNITLSNTLGLRYHKTVADNLTENRLPVTLALLLFAAVLLAVTLVYRQRGKYAQRLLESNKKLEKANEELEASNKSKSELLSRVSHEIRTPINAISGLAYLGKESTNDKAAAGYFRKIGASSQYLVGIINDILDMNKMDGDSFRLVEMRTNLRTVLDDITTIIMPLAENKGVAFTVNDISKRQFAVCDKMRLEQVVINLLTNAVKFTPEGGTVTLSVKDYVENDKIHATFIVQDTGCGMSAAFLPRLFQPFSQENRNPSLYGTGTGLGLAISRRIARSMHGDLTAESREGYGSTFTATMVFSLCTEGQPDNIQSEAKPAAGDELLHGMHVLLAEDNEINTEVAVGLLERKGILVDAVPDGDVAVKRFSESPSGHYNVILMDIRMPHLNGFDATKQIRTLARADAQTIPIYAMTADAFSDSMEKAHEEGMNGYITKPINVDQLYAALRSCTRQTEADSR